MVDVTGEVPESTLLGFLWLPFYGLMGIGLILAAGETWRAVLRSPWLVPRARLGRHRPCRDDLCRRPGLLLGLIGKDATLTGRTDIWVELGRAIFEKPALGYGYLAFWRLDSEPRYWLEKAVDWNTPSGHNGWLDLAISLGIVGVVIFAIDLAIPAWRAARLSISSPTSVFAIGFLTQFMLFAMSEGIILAQNSIL